MILVYENMIQAQPLARHDDIGVIEYLGLPKSPYFDNKFLCFIRFWNIEVKEFQSLKPDCFAVNSGLKVVWFWNCVLWKLA